MITKLKKPTHWEVTTNTEGKVITDGKDYFGKHTLFTLSFDITKLYEADEPKEEVKEGE